MTFRGAVHRGQSIYLLGNTSTYLCSRSRTASGTSGSKLAKVSSILVTFTRNERQPFQIALRAPTSVNNHLLTPSVRPFGHRQQKLFPKAEPLTVLSLKFNRAWCASNQGSPKITSQGESSASTWSITLQLTFCTHSWVKRVPIIGVALPSAKVAVWRGPW